MRMPSQKQEDGEQLKRNQKLQLCSKNGSINFKIKSDKDQNPSSKEEVVELVEPKKGEDELNMICLVCKINNGKWLLTHYYSILETCFGITVSNPALMICDRCAQLVQTTSEFRELIREAINQNTNKNVGQESEQIERHEPHKESAVDKIIPVTDTKAAAKYKMRRRSTKSVGKRILTICCICKHKYPMIVQDVNHPAAAEFVCARCKHHRPIEHNIQCDQCRTVVPAHSMCSHLEKHALARGNLFSRSRLRSLQDPISKCRQAPPSQEDIQVNVKNFKRNQQHKRSYICRICGKDLTCKEFLQNHMRVHAYSKTHECKVCGRIFKNLDAYTRHSKIHQAADPYKVVPNIPLR